MATIESIEKAYINFVLTEGEQPKSVYVFAKKNKMPEEEFYRFFASFDAIEQHIWTNFAVKTIAEIKTQEIWPQYTAREKALSFFYAFFELLKSSRSFVVYSVKKQPKTFSTPQIFQGIKDVFENFCNDLIVEGIESNELSERKFFTFLILVMQWDVSVDSLHLPFHLICKITRANLFLELANISSY